MEDVMIFKQKYPLWHGMGKGHNFNNLGNPKTVERMGLVTVSRTFAGMVYRSGLVQVAEDTRPPHQPNGRESQPWSDWVQYVLILPSISRIVNRSDIRFVIVCLSLETNALKICSEPRLASHGHFALRRNKEKQHVFLLADAPISLTHEGNYGNGLVPKIQMPFDLY